MKINLAVAGAGLPDPWRSRILGQVRPCNIKIIRMDEAGIDWEDHPDYAEALLVLDGHMDLETPDGVTRCEAGDLFIVPVGVPHRVLPGSAGLLLLVDR